MTYFEFSALWDLRAFRAGVIKVKSSRRLSPAPLCVCAGATLFALYMMLKYGTEYVDTLCFTGLLTLFMATVSVPVIAFHSAVQRRHMKAAYGTTSVQLHFAFMDEQFTIRGPLKTLTIPYAQISRIVDTKKYVHIALKNGMFYSIRRASIPKSDMYFVPFLMERKREAEDRAEA